jgi:fatty-acyl-CoA synthase
VVVKDTETAFTTAVVVPWPGLTVDARDCRRAVAARLGEAVAATLVVVAVDRVPLTEQGKPDRAVIKGLASGEAAA